MTTPDPTPPPTEPRETDDWAKEALALANDLYESAQYERMADFRPHGDKIERAAEMLKYAAPQLERLAIERDEEKVRADFADLAADNRGRVIESLEHQLSAANERLARLEEDKAQLQSAIRWALGEEGDFRVRDHRVEGQYYWRKELRERAASSNNGRASEGKAT